MSTNREELAFIDDAEENSSLSAEEIAAVLADTLQGTYHFGREYFDEEPQDSAAYEREEKEREARRRKRLKEMRRRKKQQERMRRLLIPCVVVLVACIVLIGKGIGGLIKKQQKDKISYNTALEFSMAGCYADSGIADKIQDTISHLCAQNVQPLGGNKKLPPLTAAADAETASLNSEVVSKNGVFIDVEANRIMGQRDAKARISPASMTKILTILVAAEHITDAEDKFEITREITDYSYTNKCSSMGFEIGEKVTVRDLFYGTVLPSGADAALGLAVYVAGSQEDFVALMNQKLEELGLSDSSHFTNCVGLYDENHYSTVYDMAVILKAACDNRFCREVLSAHTYTSSVTEQHPEGITKSNWFLRKIEDKDTRGEVLCAKTGYVIQSENCAASLSVGKDGKEYICVTAHSSGTWQCIYDHVALCQQFLP